MSCLILFSKTSSAREIIMGLGERLSHIGPTLDDDDDEYRHVEEEEEEIEGEKRDEAVWNGEAASKELIGIMSLHCIGKCVVEHF